MACQVPGCPAVENESLAPVANSAASSSSPPQINSSLPVQITVAPVRGAGAPWVGNAVHVSVTGSYNPPSPSNPDAFFPPKTSIERPVQTAPWPLRAEGAPSVETGIHPWGAGVKRAPVLRARSLNPPQTIISVSVQTAVCPVRAEGASIGVTSVHESRSGRYRAPVPDRVWPPIFPPQRIHSCPVQTEAPANRAEGAPTVAVAVQAGAAMLDTTVKPPWTRSGSAARNEAAIHPERAGADRV